MKRKEIKISHDEIQRALQTFQSKGGLITKVKTEGNPRRRMVGSKYASYEAVFESHIPERD